MAVEDVARNVVFLADVAEGEGRFRRAGPGTLWGLWCGQPRILEVPMTAGPHFRVPPTTRYREGLEHHDEPVLHRWIRHQRQQSGFGEVVSGIGGIELLLCQLRRLAVFLSELFDQQGQ